MRRSSNKFGSCISHTEKIRSSGLEEILVSYGSITKLGRARKTAEKRRGAAMSVWKAAEKKQKDEPQIDQLNLASSTVVMWSQD